MKRNRVISTVVILSMLLTLVACGGEQVEENSKEVFSTEQPSILSEEGQWIGKGGSFKLDRMDEKVCDRMKGSPNQLIFSDFDTICNRDGEVLYDEFVHEFQVVDDGIWCLREKGMVNGEYCQDCYAFKMDFSGQELVKFDIPIRADSLAVVDNTLYIYDMLNLKLGIFSSDGNILGEIDLAQAALEDFSAQLFTGGDDSVWLMNEESNGRYLYPVNVETKNLGTAVLLPEDMEYLSKGTEEYPFLLATKSEFDYFNPATNTITNILYWDECGLFCGELSSFIPDGDGFLCTAVNGLCRLRPAKPEEIHQRTRLVLGTVFGYDGSEFLASMFNAENEDYYIEIKDYSDDGELTQEDAQMRLNTEVISGSGPDLIMVYDMGVLQNTSAFVDLYPYLNADSELKREDFYGLKAMETSGKLLMAPNSLMISTFGVLPEVGKNRTGWTWNEYFEMESNLPAGGVMASYLGADFFLQSSLNLYTPQAIDWVNGTCSFDTPEFIRILEAAKNGYDPNCPEENPYFLDEVNSMMADGRMIMEETGFSDVESFMLNEKYNGRELSFIGWPTPDGSCGSVFNVSGIAVNATTKYEDGCWEFAKYVMKSTYAYKPTFEEAIQKATTAGVKIDGQDTMVMSQSQADRYTTLMENITVAVTGNSEVSKIVLEEASAMFAGDRSPEETARIIQSRLSIYVSERKS